MFQLSISGVRLTETFRRDGITHQLPAILLMRVEMERVSRCELVNLERNSPEVCLRVIDADS